MFESWDLINEAADILADSIGYRDIEAGFCGHIEKLSRLEPDESLAAVEADFAGTGNDFHPLGLVGAEVKAPGIDQPESLLRAVGEDDAVACDFAIEINIRFRDGGDI